MIEDKELRDLFKAESEEHLQHLDEGLLQLEKNPGDRAALEEVFREAHSLKGSARMLEVSDVETIAHRFEDILGAARRGETILVPEMVDRLYRGLDAIRKLVHEAVAAEPAGVKVPDVLAHLSGEGPHAAVQGAVPATVSHRPAQPSGSVQAPGALASDPSTSVGMAFEAPRDEAQEMRAPEELLAKGPFAPSIAEDWQAQARRYRIDTIRVDPQKLDALMTQAGELTVTKIRIARRLAELEAIKRTALRPRIMREDELAAMTPAQIQSLIFTTGFSTSPLVTDVSGRTLIQDHPGPRYWARS